MKASARVSLWLWSGAVLLAGCAGPAAPADDGAREVVRAYHEAVVRADWPGAYAMLHPESRQRWTGERFARLGEAYRRRLGFEPERVYVRSCEEQGERAVAHVTLAGPGRRQQFRDGVELRRAEGAWRVVLAATFGR